MRRSGKGEYALKNVRVWFKKDGVTRYISHLDLNRVMLRAVQKSKIPIWYTEGFNPHPFLTFALPLSLGFRGVKESMDMRLVKDVSFKSIIDGFNNALPDGIRVFAVTEPIMKPGKIAFADFEILLSSDDFSAEEIINMVNCTVNQEQILIDKKTKSGIKQIDIKPSVIKFSSQIKDDSALVKLTLPAGSVNNTNPSLLIKAAENKYDTELFADVTRLELYNEKGEIFE